MDLMLRPLGSPLHEPPYSQLQGQFRGALLGMTLADIVGPELCITLPVQTVGANADAPMPLTIPVLKSAVPGLLRYHDSRARRCLWIRQWGLANLHQGSIAVPVQMLLLGDVLEVVLSHGQATLLSEITQLPTHSARYDLSSRQHQYYRASVARLLRQLVSVDAIALRQSISQMSAASTDALTSVESDACWYGMASALKYVESPVLSVQMAGARGAIAAMVAGLVSGATSGVAGLPISWQMNRRQTHKLNDEMEKTDRKVLGDDAKTESHRVRCCGTTENRVESAVEIADELFAQWAGMNSGLV